jgi:glycosyltransferase involved in cell wall biosynthesis
LTRVLFQVRPDHGTQVGGDTLHAVRTAEELRALGIDAEVTGDPVRDLSAYDVVHLFNTELVEPTFRQTLRARAAGVPIVLTPIFWRPPLEDESFRWSDRVNFARRAEVMRHAVFGLVDALTPSSRIELDRIVARYAAVPRLREVVPVGVDSRFALGDGERFCTKHELPLRGFLLCVARIEGRKNQLRLIEACADFDLPLVLIGPVYDDRRAYFDSCRELARRLGKDVRFLSVPQDEIPDAYAAARAHVLPSLWETVGLVSIEAAVAGCNVVSTVECGVREYLGDRAWYCDPESIDSIRASVEAALAAPVDDRLRDVASDFPWSEAAERLRPVYEAVVSRRANESTRSDWRAALTTEQYIEHLESLIQLQLETISLRDGHYAAARESAEQAAEYARSLEADRARREEYVRTLQAEVAWPAFARRIARAARERRRRT